MIYVKVPATSANMGAGFDSLGIAIGLYNNLKISETDNGLTVYNNSKEYIPTGDRNLVYRAICRVFDEVGYIKKGIKIVQNSNIPVTRGLGSSGASIIGGMLAANAISGRKLSYDDILYLATEMEGHPDNVTPALYGGFCVSARHKGKVIYTSSKPIGLAAAVMIPEFFLSTRKSRTALPENVTLEDASYNISRAALMTSLIISGKYDKLRYASGDRLHQDFRKINVPGFDDITRKSYELGAATTYLSGSGPTIVSLISEDFKKFEKEMSEYLRTFDIKWKCRVLPIDNVGAVVKEIKVKGD